ncbi:MAG TPA: PEP-CTERM sorting domain-containing protein [Candidatus Acidoferrum sp.]|nr:PEP-CTERM sorting domain-containing protein [Candidatus Acidoferrum sp.]
MKKPLILVAFALCSGSVFALPDYEPFADASSSGGTTYTIGANLIGQTNAGGQAWFQAGPANSTQPTITAGSLSYADLPPSQGNSVGFGGNGESARLNTSSIVGSGTLYFSFLLDASSAPSGGSGGVFWAGFNNSAGSQSTTPTTIATRVYSKPSGSGYLLGVSKNSSSTSDWVWDTTVHSFGETVLVVGSYTFNTASTSDDVSQLWIDPPVITPGGAAPTPTLVATTGGDITSSQIASFVLFDRSASELAGTLDELRIGNSYASVVPEPSTAVLGGLGVLALVTFWRGRRH